MPSISKIRFTNLIYENGCKRYNDDIFEFDGHNGALLLENGGGKTVFVQSAMQAVLPHHDLAERKVRNTLSLEGEPCHVAIEWIINERPRRYALTAVTLYLSNNKLESYKYVYQYDHRDDHSIEKLPFVKKIKGGKVRSSSKAEILEYYQYMNNNYTVAKTFKTIKDFHEYIEESFKIIPSEWRNIALINSAEGGVEAFFEDCKTTNQLLNKLLIPVVEEAIAYDSKTNFVETFEKHREHFKSHKQLRERIEECKKIESQIASYVDVYKRYHDIKQEYEERKKYSKAIYLHTENERDEISKELIYLEERINAIRRDKNELSRKKLSLELAGIMKEINEAKQIHDYNSKNYNEIKEDHETAHTQINSLTIARLKKDIKDGQERIESYLKELKLLEEKAGLEEIRENIDENSRKLRGYFLGQEDKYEKKITVINNQHDRYEEEHKQKKNDLLTSTKEKNGIDRLISNKDGEIKRINKNLMELMREIPEDVEEGDIHERLRKWIDDNGKLEQEKVDIKNTISRLKIEEARLKTDLQEYRDKNIKASKELTAINEKIKVYESNHNRILEKIKPLNPNWYYIDNIYTKENSILNFLNDKIIKLKTEKVEIEKQERVSRRLLDFHSDNKVFTAEPLLEKWTTDISGYGYLEVGTKFLQRAIENLQLNIDDVFEVYPFWSTTLVVEDKRGSDLVEKLLDIKAKITYPIMVLTESEARAIIKGDCTKGDRIVYPEHWKSNIKNEDFRSWLNQLRIEADEILKTRESKEKEILSYNKGLEAIKDFIWDFPYEEYQKIKKSFAETTKALELLNQSVKTLEDRSFQIEEEKDKLNKRNDNLYIQISYLNTWIATSSKYVRDAESRDKLLIENKQLKDKLNNIEIRIEALSVEVARMEDIMKDIDDQRQQLRDDINRLKEQELYKNVQGFDPIYSASSWEVLVTERDRLLELYNSGEMDIKGIEDKIKEEENKIEDCTLKIDEERLKSEYTIDEDMTFPNNGNKLLSALIQKSRTLKEKLDSLAIPLRGSEKKYDELKQKYKYRYKEFLKSYSELYEFSESIYEAERVLEKEEKELLKLEERVNNQYSSREVIVENINQALELLKRKHEKHDYLKGDVASKELDDDFKRDYPYDRLKLINTKVSELEELFDSIKTSREAVEGQRSRFITFCENEIRNPKLKSLTISGIGYKDKFKDLTEWQSKMNESILHIIRVAEDDLREHDKELEFFIEHLLKYITSVTEELRMIPRNTRIKVDDRFKEIYLLKVPEWKEEEGKEDLRKYVDWMIGELEKKEIEVETLDDTVSTRKDIEKWLKTKVLLDVVLRNNNIRISCRKVTNDGKVSSAPTTWENSNRWSGGEKWSKNMTLFLGILNYLAEKRQSIIPSNKLNRVVIVDNPFGKASSDHVLDPVFFIAKRLGFQIIALTAHAQGKFIRSYFPVVYSCRLREATSGNSLIVDKNKEIHHAFFKDNDPDALIRLGDHVQLNIFEDIKQIR